jgi:hypothetical protein
MSKPIFLIEYDEYISDEKYDVVREHFEKELPDYKVLMVVKDEDINFKF